MSTQNANTQHERPGPQGRAATPASGQTSTAVAKKEGSAVEFVPFGAQDAIKLSAAIVIRLLAKPTKSGKTCTEDDAIRFVMLCQAQRLNPFAGDAYIVGYDSQQGPQFSLITAHQAFLKRAEASKEFLGMDSGVILWDEEKNQIIEREGDFHLPDEKVVGGWAKVWHALRPEHPTYRRLRKARFDKGQGQWAVDAAGMIVKCAEADALRSTFPTLLGGLRIEGEAIEVETTVTETSRPVFQNRKPTRTIADAQEQNRAANPEPNTDPVNQPGNGNEPTPEPSEPAIVINEEKPIEQIKEWCKRDDVSEVQILAWAHQTKIAKADQTDLIQLATQKLVNILTNWKTLLPTWKAIKAD